MKKHKVIFQPSGRRGEVEEGKTLLEAAQSLGVDIEDSNFDFDSIMLYPSSAFALLPGELAMTNLLREPYPGNRTGELSEEDVKRVNKVYKLYK